MKNYEKAKLSFKKAIELDPNQKKYFYNLGVVYDDNNELDEAIRCLRKAMNFDKFYEDAQKRLDSCLKKQQKNG